FREPAVASASEHVPADTVPVQLLTPSLTSTLPVGVPVPGATTLTVYVTANVSPTTVGSGVSAVIAAVVDALLTVCVTPPDAGLALNFASPPYVAVRVCGPRPVNEPEHV